METDMPATGSKPCERAATHQMSPPTTQPCTAASAAGPAASPGPAASSRSMRDPQLWMRAPEAVLQQV